MNTQVVRNMAQLEEVIRQLKELGPPLVIASQRVGVTRSTDANEYLWGVVYKTISEATGQDALKIHEGYKKMFNFRYDFRFNKKKNMFEVFPTDSTANLFSRDFWNFIMKVRADAEVDMNIMIPMPNELFTEQLSFNNEP